MSSKLGALLILKTILEMPIDPNAFQDQYESPDEAHQTIVQASFVRPVEGVEVEAD